jgi:proteic killer suppression protein
MAVLIFRRIDQIQASPDVDFMILHRIGRCHALKGNRKGQYAVDLVHPYRMLFEKQDEEIQIARIVEITDYH